MKKTLLALAALAMMLTACTKFDSDSNRSMVSFAISAAEMGTRAYGDGTTANNLYYAIYQIDAEDVDNPKIAAQTPLRTAALKDAFAGDALATTVTESLAKGGAYCMIFWADSSTGDATIESGANDNANSVYNTAEDSPYTIDWSAANGPTVSFKDVESLTSQDESLDAFFGQVAFTVTQSQSLKVELKRPFAQLNIATRDTFSANRGGLSVKRTAIKVGNVYTSLNLNTGAVYDSAELYYAPAEIPSGDDAVLTINDSSREYDRLSMNYLLVNEKENVRVRFSVYDRYSFSSYDNLAVTRLYSNIPLQRNYRTNIIGNLLTSSIDFKVVIRPGFTDEHIKEED